MSADPVRSRFASPATREEAVRRYVAGEAARAIGEALGFSRGAVLNWVRDAGGTIRERSFRSSATATRARRLAGRPSSRRPPAECAEAVRRYLAGESSETVARDVGVTGTTILKWVRNAGHTPRPRGGGPGSRSAGAAPRPRVSSVSSSPAAPSPECGGWDPPWRRHITPPLDLGGELKAGGEVVLRAVDDGDGHVVLVARATTSNQKGTPDVAQVSLDPSDSAVWPRTLLQLLDRSRIAEQAALKRGMTREAARAREVCRLEEDSDGR